MELMTGNPFFNRGCIEDARDFYGRERDLREVFNLLCKPTPQSVSIVGQRKIGKSSFLKHIMREDVISAHGIHASNMIMVYLNFEGLTYLSELECLQKLMWDTHATLAQAGIHPGEELKIDLSASTPMRVIDGLNRLFAYLRGPASRAEETAPVIRRRLIYVFDEFEVSCANPHLTIGFFNTLRSFATSFGIAYVVATKQELWRLPHYRLGKSSPFFNYFTTHYLTLFSEADAHALIDSGRTGGYSLADDEAFLTAYAGLFPFFLQMLCWYLWDKRSQGVSTESARAQAVREFDAQATGYFAYLWDTLSSEERAVVQVLARRAPAQKLDSAVLEGLRRKALVANGNGQPRLFSDAFSSYISSMCQTVGEASLVQPA